MNIFVLDTSFTTVAVIDGFKSFIWTDRYNTCGDFELVMPLDSEILRTIQINYYLQCALSDRTMIVETIELNTDEDEGVFVTFSGRSLESILDRRVVWEYYTYTGSMQTGIQQILTNNIISPSDSNRRISNFRFQASTTTDITEIEWDFALLGDNVYEVIQEVCQANDVGFKIVLNASNQFVFSLYIGRDMSFNQTTLPWVVFSPTFDNLLSSKYYCSDTTKRTVCMIAGAGETEPERDIVEATLDEGSIEDPSRVYRRRWGYKSNSSGTYTGGVGLERKEIYADGSGISKTYRDENDEEQTWTAEEYANLLIALGQEELGEYITTQTFEGDTDYEGNFVYGRDYEIGDILQIENEYGITAAVRVEEVVNTIDDSGQSVVPSFTAV